MFVKFSTMTLIDFFGVTGLFLLLLAFFLNSTGKIKRNSYPYHIINFLGGFILAVYGAIINAIVFMILNSFWAIVALLGIVKKKIRSSYPEIMKK
jgi:hypothetical protein